MHIPHVDELKLWFGGVPKYATDHLKPSDIAKELYRLYGDGVGKIELKRGFMIVSFSKKTMNAILHETKGGSRLYLCKERWSVMKFDKTQLGPGAGGTLPQRSRSRSTRKSQSLSRSRRRSRSGSRSSCGSAGSEKTKEMLNALFASKAGAGLNKEVITQKLSGLSVKSQMEVIKIYRDSDVSAIRNPMGWFSSIIRTISLGLKHGGCPAAAGYRRAIPHYKPQRSVSRQRQRSPSHQRQRSLSPQRQRSLSVDEKRSRAGSSPRRNRRSPAVRKRQSPARHRRSPSRKRKRREPSREQWEQQRAFKRWSPYLRRLGPKTDKYGNAISSTVPAHQKCRKFSLSVSRSSKGSRTRSSSKRSRSVASARSASRPSVRSGAKK